MKSLLAGIAIGLGAIAYLNIGGVYGAIFFSLGLMIILSFQMELFTGKAGLLVTREIDWLKLAEIWVGNFLGTFLVAALYSMTPAGVALAVEAAEIIAVRVSNGYLVNFLLGIGCGVLMFVACRFYDKLGPGYIVFPIAVFILAGFNHCVADMFYLHMNCTEFLAYKVLIPTTIGNLVGCNIIPWAYSSVFNQEG